MSKVLSKRIENLRKIMYARSVAVIGASNKKGTVGNEIILRLKEFGFKGKIYPVNLKYESVEDITAFASVIDIKKDVDVAVIAIPNINVLSAIEECHKANINGVIIISSGFKEIGAEGLKLEQDIIKTIKKYEMTLIGPNCLGVINSSPNVNFNACFAPENPVAGKIGLATQSGALASGIINILPQIRVGLGQMISLGNQADINVLDVIELWEHDDNINQILIYIESIPDSKRFKEICARVNKVKPILVIKSGRSSIGTKAAASHTGSLAGDDTLADALLSSAGVIREKYLREMFITAQVFNNCNLPKNEKLAIITNAGGPGVMATDTASEYNIELAELSDATKQTLKQFLPPQAGINNPLDVIASATHEQYTKAVDTVLSDSNVGMLMVIYLYITEQNDTGIIEDLEELKNKYLDKPIVAVFMTTTDFPIRLKKIIKNCTIPIFSYAVDAMHGISRLLERKHSLCVERNETPEIKVDEKAVKNILEQYKKSGIKQISTYSSLKIFEYYNIPVAKFEPAYTFKDAEKIAEKIGYPVVLKISSKTISHKTEVGGVVTNIRNKNELQNEWNALFNRLEKLNEIENLECVIVMKQINSKREFVAGIVNKQGENVAMFGVGGIFLEVLKEVAFSACPLSAYNAENLIKKTKAFNMLKEVRGFKPADLTKMRNILLSLSQMVEENSEINEIDINPIMVSSEGEIFTVDARIVLK
ncbi:MAG: acetate--CoA ligase family protein [Clostridia bacterium]|nr:acetate--CoA ligase family protein [Clostridia bacterium]